MATLFIPWIDTLINRAIGEVLKAKNAVITTHRGTGYGKHSRISSEGHCVSQSPSDPT